MTQKTDFIEFDDSAAVKFILEALNKKNISGVDDQMVEYVLDLICEYYDENGLVDEDDTVEEAEVAEDDMFNFISEYIKKEDIFDISDETLYSILEEEFNYGKSIGVYN